MFRTLYNSADFLLVPDKVRSDLIAEFIHLLEFRRNLPCLRQTFFTDQGAESLLDGTSGVVCFRIMPVIRESQSQHEEMRLVGAQQGTGDFIFHSLIIPLRPCVDLFREKVPAFNIGAAAENKDERSTPVTFFCPFQVGGPDRGGTYARSVPCEPDFRGKFPDPFQVFIAVVRIGWRGFRTPVHRRAEIDFCLRVFPPQLFRNSAYECVIGVAAVRVFFRFLDIAGIADIIVLEHETAAVGNDIFRLTVNDFKINGGGAVKFCLRSPFDGMCRDTPFYPQRGEEFSHFPVIGGIFFCGYFLPFFPVSPDVRYVPWANQQHDVKFVQEMQFCPIPFGYLLEIAGTAPVTAVFCCRVVINLC